jgi:hypothetical protein
LSNPDSAKLQRELDAAVLTADAFLPACHVKAGKIISGENKLQIFFEFNKSRLNKKEIYI